MKKKLILLLIVIATVFILAGPALAEGDKLRGDNATGPAYQYMWCGDRP